MYSELLYFRLSSFVLSRIVLAAVALRASIAVCFIALGEMITYPTNITLDFIAFPYSAFLLDTFLRGPAVAFHCFLFSYFFFHLLSRALFFQASSGS